MTITPLDDVSFQLFAPNTDAMDEAREMIEEFLTDEVCEYSIMNTCCSNVMY